jgi:hypothetical protein
MRIRDTSCRVRIGVRVGLIRFLASLVVAGVQFVRTAIDLPMNAAVPAPTLGDPSAGFRVLSRTRRRDTDEPAAFEQRLLAVDSGHRADLDALADRLTRPSEWVDAETDPPDTRCRTRTSGEVIEVHEVIAPETSAPVSGGPTRVLEVLSHWPAQSAPMDLCFHARGFIDFSGLAAP